jgi:hypothetical protein
VKELFTARQVTRAFGEVVVRLTTEHGVLAAGVIDWVVVIEIINIALDVENWAGQSGGNS